MARMKLEEEWKMGAPPQRWQWWFIACSFVLYLGIVGCSTSSSTTDSPTAGLDDVAPENSQPELLPEEDSSLAQTQGQMLPITAEVELGEQTISLEVAETRQQQAIGLMHREVLADDRGMLFPFDPPRPVNFWMKNVLISLDMVFVHQGQVIEIAEEVPPCVADPCPTYGPDRQVVDYVIELRGGLAQEIGLQVGDTVEIQWLESPLEPSN